MRLSADVLHEVVESLHSKGTDADFQMGRGPVPVNPAPRAILAPRARIRPCGNGQTRRAMSVAVRCVTACGIAFVDSSYWMDGEHFILQVPQVRVFGSMLCAVTHWQPIASDLFIVSANFIRQLDLACSDEGRGDDRSHHASGL
jgi:hypothetical protein